MTTFTTEDREAMEKGLEFFKQLRKAGMSRQDIADALGMSRQNVGYIEEKALKKIRTELFKRGIGKEDLL